MFNCTDLVSRKYCANVTAHAIHRLFSIYYRTAPEKRGNSEAMKDVKKTLDDFYDMLFTAMKDSECHRAWSRLEGFLKLVDMCSSKMLS